MKQRKSGKSPLFGGLIIEPVAHQNRTVRELNLSALRQGNAGEEAQHFQFLGGALGFQDGFAPADSQFAFGDPILYHGLACNGNLTGEMGGMAACFPFKRKGQDMAEGFSGQGMDFQLGCPDGTRGGPAIQNMQCWRCLEGKVDVPAECICQGQISTAVNGHRLFPAGDMPAWDLERSGSDAVARKGSQGFENVR